MIQLPVELQEHILSFLDGATFSKSRLVCKLWRNLYDTIQDRYSIWKFCCLEEITLDVLLHITCCTSLQQLVDLYAKVSKSQEDSWQCWKTLYITWYRTRFVGKWIPLETFIQIDGYEDRDGYINCAKILGDHLVVGCKDGHVGFIDSLTGEENKQFPIQIVQNVDVTDVLFMRLGSGVDFVKSVACYDHIIVSTVWGHVKLTSLEDGHASESAVLGYVGSLDSWGPLVVIENNRYGANQCELLTVIKNSQEQHSLSHVETLLNYDWGCSLSQIWRDKVLCGGIDQVLMIHRNIPKNTLDHMISGLENVRFLMNHVEEKYVDDLVYKAGVALCVTDNGLLHTSIDDGQTWASWNSMLDVGSKPIKLALWGPLLAVAFLSGQVNVYYMPNKTDFMCKFLDNPSAVIHTDSRLCSYMDIGDDGEGPMIVIVTESGIKVVRWFHQIKE